MSFIVSPKYENGSWVMFRRYTNGRYEEWEKGKITAISANQSEHFRPDYCMIGYLIIPERFVGVECDEEVRIGESDVRSI